MLISPSINMTKPQELQEYTMQMQNMGADYLHVDIMDGKFVKNVALSAQVTEQLSYMTLLPLDVHLMCVKPLKQIKIYSALKLHSITTHIEAYDSDLQILRAIKICEDQRILFGLSIKPATPVEQIYRLLPYINYVMVMGVEPGLSGQTFITSTLDKIKAIKQYISSNNLHTQIVVDGGVNLDNVAAIKKAGADIVVMANAIYNASDRQHVFDYVKAL